MERELIPEVRKLFDLNLYEAKIWLALLGKGTSTPGELSSISGVPRSRSYDILESLERRGFVMMKPGRPVKYTALDPIEVVERAKEYVRKTAEEKIKELEESKKGTLVRRLGQIFKEGTKYAELKELSGVLRGRMKIYDKLRKLIGEAKESVVLMTTDSGVASKLPVLKMELEAAKKRGVSVKIAAPLTKESREALEELSKVASVKIAKDLEARFCLIDGRHLIMMPADDKEIEAASDIGIWIQSEKFAKSMENFVAIAWDKLKSFK